MCMYFVCVCTLYVCVCTLYVCVLISMCVYVSMSYIYILLTKTTATQNEVALSYQRVKCGAMFCRSCLCSDYKYSYKGFCKCTK